MNNSITFNIGVDFLSTFIRMPPDATKSDANKAIKAKYSASV